ncbi:hypothetical protein TNCV_3988951 [Trichonephila clavipes]|nr:hypothetical protein TNCV_3988951 [Trichonephila clavipes]
MSFDCDFGVLWILSNNHSALQHLSGWTFTNDETNVSILLQLKKISQTNDVHLQWIPAHVNIKGNEVAIRHTGQGSDEAHFWLNGYVNKQNCRIWSEANPQVYVETPLHPEKLTVWCALWWKPS